MNATLKHFCADLLLLPIDLREIILVQQGVLRVQQEEIEQLTANSPTRRPRWQALRERISRSSRTPLYGPPATVLGSKPLDRRKGISTDIGN
jgi:hypothetical protein